MAPDDNWTALAPTRPIRQGSAHCRAATRRGPSGKEAAPISGHPYTSDSGPASFTPRRNDHDFSVVLRKRRLVCPLHKKGRTRTRARTRSDSVNGHRRQRISLSWRSAASTWMAAKPQNTASERRHRNSYRQGDRRHRDTLRPHCLRHFMDKTENRATYGLFYTLATVDTGKIRPEGWTVPDWDQMQSLLDAVPKSGRSYGARQPVEPPQSHQRFRIRCPARRHPILLLLADIRCRYLDILCNSPGYLYSVQHAPHCAILLTGHVCPLQKSTNTSDWRNAALIICDYCLFAGGSPALVGASQHAAATRSERNRRSCPPAACTHRRQSPPHGTVVGRRYLRRRCSHRSLRRRGRTPSRRPMHCATSTMRVFTLKRGLVP